MSRTQRFVLLGLAAAILVVALVVLPGDDDDSGSTIAETVEGVSSATNGHDGAVTLPTTTATIETTPAPKPKPKPPLLRAGAARELEFEKGDTVRFRVRHDQPEEIHVHGYDIAKDLPPNKTVTMSFKANLEGIFEVELEHSGTPLGTIKVEPK